ncbi:MAG: tRNA (adenosine(37)-N6)-threonylcarbamoyltransferase complex transferase subunit TsaD [Candidatus Sungbacteria bacterium]|nr:tRNA (adenosine(37)-N6)-threonylcarbamoyltransferase complex transferase subunit TsaD [Candidatus Sungbacteria bacterium]
MVILGIETSCDETAIAVIEIGDPKKKPRIKILSNIILSQIPFHRKFGGVVPNLAKREHQRNLAPILIRALKEAELRNSKSEIRNPKQIQNSKLQVLNSILEREPELLERFKKDVVPIRPPQVDAIAVTTGPGLEPALWTGVNFARALSFLWKKPIIPVNHLEGHIYTVMLGNRPALKQMFQLQELKPPTLVLIASGGHTELILMRKPGLYSVIGETRDDAAGEAFDKVARLLGLGYPGGPEIAAQAAKIKIGSSKLKISLPRPMIKSPDFDFSFSGLKTAVRYLLQDLQKKHSLKNLRGPISKEFQDAVVEVLVAKTIRAAKKFKVKSVILGGGVAANKLLRETLEKEVKRQLPSTTLHLPATSLTGDNALMIALAAYFSKKEKHWSKLRAIANMRLDKKSR